jgi:haloacetate dehalogenase
MLALWGDRGRPHKRQSVLEIWQKWTHEVSGHGLAYGHFIPEEAPEETVDALRTFFEG